MGDMKQICSLSDSRKLRELIVENPGLPLVVFCGEEAWSGEYGYEQADVVQVGIREMALLEDHWVDKDDYRDEVADNMCDKKGYRDLPDREFEEMIDKRVQGTEFVKAIVIYVG